MDILEVIGDWTFLEIFVSCYMVFSILCFSNTFFNWFAIKVLGFESTPYD